MINKMIGILVLTISFSGGWIWMKYNNFINTPIQFEQDVRYIIKPGYTVKKIARDLTMDGFLSHPWYFRLYARLSNNAHKIKAGEYRLSGALKPSELLSLFIKGTVIQHSITLVEGFTFKQILQTIFKNRVLVHTLGKKSTQEIMDQLGYPDENPEGRFYPDTYYFTKSTTDVQFLGRAYNMMTTILAEEWQNRLKGLPIKTPYETLILASIIEKESAWGSERDKISGVFIRRLKTRMKLQSDPTVIYGMGDRYQGRIYKKDLREDTPYNTYVHYKLPPTPIAIPSRQSIYFALHPAPGKELYFVANGTGGHHFSETLGEHNRAVRKFILGKK